MQRIWLVLFAASALNAQYAEFAVTDDGRLSFTSVLNLPSGGDIDNPAAKVYRFTGDGLALAASGNGGADPFGPGMVSPLASGDGSVTGYAIHYPCRSGSCGLSGVPRTFFTIEAAGLDRLPATSMQVSRNGRFLLWSTFDGRLNRMELPSRQITGLGQFVYGPAGRQSLANTGAILANGPNGSRSLRILLDGEPPIEIPSTREATFGLLSPDALRAVYERPRGDGFELILTAAPFTVQRTLAFYPQRLISQPSFANDGTLLYLAPDADGRPQPFLATPAGDTSALAAVPEGAAQSILSGNGELAWVSTHTGRLLRIRTGDGAVDEMIPETPFVRTNTQFAYPGSVIRFIGSGIGRHTRYRLSGFDLPFSETTAEGAAVQIPWEITPSAQAPTIRLANPESPFVQTVPFTLLDQPTISFERAGPDNTLQLAHQDFSGPVTAAHPALPGETLHLFVRNMGPVDRPVATGEPSPADPPARVTIPFACYLSDRIDEPGQRVAGLQVPFAGLAGGGIGIYQIDLTVPPDWTARQSSLTCRTGFRGDVGVVFVQPAATSPSR